VNRNIFSSLLKTNLTVLEECERVEDVVLAAYQDALKEEVLQNLHALIT